MKWTVKCHFMVKIYINMCIYKYKYQTGNYYCWMEIRSDFHYCFSVSDLDSKLKHTGDLLWESSVEASKGLSRGLTADIGSESRGTWV